jgi:peptidoglycan/LPS O-acetylase OafA/YrhL
MGFMFFTGASYYVLKERVRLSWVLFWVFAGVVALSSLNKAAFFLSYNLVLAYMLLFLAYFPSGMVRAYNRLGDYSYGVYIYAFPVEQSAEALFPGISWSRMVLLSAPVTLGLAALSWHLLEKRALALKASLLDRTRRVVRMQPSNPGIRPALKEIP